MDLSFLLPNSDYDVESSTIDELPTLLRLTIRPHAATVCCPCCGTSTKRVHSHYKRQLKDISCSRRQVAIAINVRRFFCDNSGCKRRIFAERLTGLAAVHARRTERLVDLMQEFGLLLGGTASIQILGRLPVSSSRWTVLRDVRKMSLTAGKTPRVLGIDDWALRRGHRYGTILVDMETTRVVELLPDREADTVTTWLKAHPGVEIVSRDRGGAYAQAARQGAPQAIQVADRWHLFKNLGEALTNLFGRYRRTLKQLTVEESLEPPENTTVKVEAVAKIIRSLPNQKRFERFELVRQLREDGLTISAIANQIPLDRKTIRKYLNTDRFPDWYGTDSPKRVSKLAPFKDYLLSHGLDGHRTVRQLWRDIQEQGFTGSLSIVAEFMAATHHLTPVSIKHTDTPVQGTSKSEKLTPRQATLWPSHKFDFERITSGLHHGDQRIDQCRSHHDWNFIIPCKCEHSVFSVGFNSDGNIRWQSPRRRGPN